MAYFVAVAFLLLMVVSGAGCVPAAAQEQQQIQLPTLAQLPTTPEHNLEAAERVSRLFLEAWSNADFPRMYELISFASQEATPYETFLAAYENARDEMTLLDVTYQGNTLLRERDDIAVFNYNVAFSTQILGQFNDLNRSMQLVVDERAGDWRVAWTSADIFPELVGGARLRLERIIPSRANIYDQNGRTLADMNGRVVIVSVIRQEIPQYEACMNTVSDALGQPVADVQERLEARPADWLMELGIIEAQTYTEIGDTLITLCDAQFRNRPVRRYVSGSIAPHILGYVGYPDEVDLPEIQAAGFAQDSILGRSGLELSWDETLRGHPGGRLTITTPGGDVLRLIAEGDPQPSESLWLTIDADFQLAVQQIIANTYSSGRAGGQSNGASAVVMNVHTGEILAMVSYPTFDNNAYTTYPSMGREEANNLIEQFQADPHRPELNRPTQGLYPLGSAMKVVSSIAVLDSGVYDLDTTYNCTAIWNRDIPRFDWTPAGHGVNNTAGAITRSCNPFFYEVGYQLDQRDPWLLPSYARRMGLDEVTGLGDLPEEGGVIGDPDWLETTYGAAWTYSEAVNMSIGQGYIGVTPLQVVRLYAAIANGGDLYRPRLVAQAGLLGETPSYIATPEVMSNADIRFDVLQEVRDGMCAVTSTDPGTAEYQFTNSPLQVLGVCGKTGTAQDPRPAATSHAWFAAYAPRDEPEIAVVVMVENSGEGSGVAAPIVRDIMEVYFFGEDVP
ncbi:MAG: hypothetical protein H7175_19585 [Burkholderiales bacterium]|nr:hypothetical protein [Anaerolineae bacterium]